MITKEIAQSDWAQFFNNFSRQHEGWMVTLEMFGSGIGAQIEDGDLGFEGIVADANGKEIAVMIGTKADEHVTHTIEHPKSVKVEQTDEGIPVAVAINSEERTTIVKFRAVELPQFVNGVAN